MDNPGCKVSDNEEITCPEPTVNEKVNDTVDTGFFKSSNDKKLVKSCVMRNCPNERCASVGVLPKGKVIAVEQASSDWYNYYNSPGGDMVFLGHDCFNSRNKKVKKHGK